MKSAQRFLPGFNTAPGVNRLTLFGRAPLPARNISKSENELIKHRRALVKEIGAVACPYGELREITVANWGQLVIAVDEWLHQNFPESTKDALTAERSFLEAAHQGVYTIKAYQQVVPKVITTIVGIQPSDYIYSCVRASAGMIDEWAGLDGRVDPRLAYALSFSTPPNMDVVFEGLIFDPSMFTFDSITKHVLLNPNTSVRLKDNARQHPTSNQMPTEQLWGCPAVQMIPRLYSSMATIAYNSGLFEV